MKNANTKRIVEQALAKVTESQESITEAANMALGLGNVKVGSDVAMMDDSTLPVSGLKGKVNKIDNGTAYVELANGVEVPLLVNQLIAL